MGEHDVSPDVQSELQTPFPEINITSVDAGFDTAPLLEALADEGVETEFIDGSKCFDKSRSDPGAQLTLDLLLRPESKKKASDCNIHLIVVAGKNDYQNVTDLAVSIINYRESGKSETLRIHAEGNVRGFLPAPVPYLSLFYFRSTPDTEGSALEALAEAIAKKIEAEINERPVRLLYLRSNNLPSVARNLAQTAKPGEASKFPGDADDDSEMSRYNPLYFYVEMNKEGAAEGNPMVHNPIGQLMLLGISITATPFFIIFDSINSPSSNKASDDEAVTATEQSARANATEAINRQDWEAGYRHLEDCIHSRNNTVREYCRYLLNNNPALRVAAKQTFSEPALQQSKSLYGDAALRIEQQRLAIYERITTEENIATASKNMHKVFPGYQYISEWKLRQEAGIYCPNADLGHTDAQKHIADIYFYGRYNVNKDMQRAYVWYSLAVTGGSDEADTRLGSVESVLTPDQLTEAQRLFEQWEPGQCERDLFRNSIGVTPYVGSGANPVN